jgi:hypothetical protein
MQMSSLVLLGCQSGGKKGTRSGRKASRIHIGIWMLLLVLALGSTGQSQTTYYIASDGNDGNDGRSTSTPWKTIAKVNSTSLNPGDAVLFRSGDTFFGQINVNQSGSAASPIRFASYGSSSEKPVINGAVRLTNWTAYSGSIYSTHAPQFIKNLHANEQQMTLARYPNSGLISNSGTDGLTMLSAPEVSRGSGTWKGANVRVRTTNFTFETRTIASISGNSIYFNRQMDLPFETGWGFYVDGILSELDAPGEWFCDQGTNTVYFQAPDDGDPNSFAIDGTALDYGVNCAADYVSVEGLRFEYQAIAAVHYGTSTGNRVASNEIYKSGGSGILSDGTADNFTIVSNTISNVNGCGVRLARGNNNTIADNHITNVGLVHGYGISGVGGAVGIVAFYGGSNQIQRNNLDSIGYTGIWSGGAYGLVEQNIISNTMLKYADGAALYSWSEIPPTTYGQTWRNNIINHVKGDQEGVPGYAWKVANGIYLDHACHDMVIEGNTVVRALSNGLFMQFDCYNNTIRENNFYDCARNDGGHYLWIYQNPSGPYGGNHVMKNVFQSLEERVMPFFMLQGESYVPLGVMDSNYFGSPHQNPMAEVMTMPGDWSSTFYTMEQWRSLSNQDQHSTMSNATLVPIVVTDSSAEQMANSTFGSGTDGWFPWGSGVSISYTTSASLDGGALRAQLASSSSVNEAVAADIQGVSQGQWYQVRFSSRATSASIVMVGIREYHEPWELLTLQLPCPVGTNREEHTFYIHSDVTDGQARLEFRCTQPGTVFFLDNVSFKPVEGVPLAIQDQVPIFTNASASPRSFQVGANTYVDVNGNPIPASLQLAPYSSKILIRASSLPSQQTGVEEQGTGLQGFDFRLDQNYPNPFNPSTTIRYSLPEKSMTRLEVFDVTGRKVATLVDEEQDPGPHQAVFQGASLASGMYFYRLTSNRNSSTRKLLLVK